MTKTVDVIIPVYKPGAKFGKLISMLSVQTVRPGKIIIINTEKSLWDSAGGDKLIDTYASGLDIRVRHISREEFDHGRTRNEAVEASDSELFICMTQDAVPADEFLIEILAKSICGNVKTAYARQLPAHDCSVLESITRQFNYPEQGMIKTAGDIDKLGIKTFFSSNVCACYDRETFDELGGFDTKAIFNEDMIYAAGLVKSGKAICYRADAKVYHSHNYTPLQQLHRNFDNGVSQAQHPEIFEGIRSESEGIKLVKAAAAELNGRGLWYRIPELIISSGAKYLGFRLGRSYRRLPAGLVRKLSLNQCYWRNGQ